jgi:peptidoglycan/xylan/chitin deacetylase (PgdA/CDA1 family)
MLAEWIDAGRGYLSGWKRRAERRRGIRIFRYHGVVECRNDPVLDRNQHVLAVFRAQMDYLQRFRILSMEELVAELESPEEPEKPAVAITFDDGFVNNLIVADELGRRKIPWCLFVPSGEVGDWRPMWLIEASLLLMRGDAERLDLLGESWSLRSRGDRERTFSKLRARLKSIPAASRREAMAALRAQFPSGETERILTDVPWLRMLSWVELEQLRDAGAEIGSHGVHHEGHHGRQPAEVRSEELELSRLELSARMGRPCRYFAYPTGDFVVESPQEVHRAGYEAAVTTVSATVQGCLRADRFLLPRLPAPSSLRAFVRSIWWEDAPATGSDALRTSKPERDIPA